MSSTRWIAFVIGLWIAVSAFVGLGDAALFWSDLLAGVAIIATGVTLTRESAVEGWLELILGAWMVAVAFIPGLHGGAALHWNNILVGGVMALLAVIPTGHAGRPHPAT